MTASRVESRKASEIDIGEVSWCWTDRIPFGTVSLVVGAAKTGKSTLASWLTAELITTTVSTGTIHLCLSEDPAETVTRPRLGAAGVPTKDLTRVYVREQAWRFPRDLELFGREMQGTGVRLAVLDPVDNIFQQICAVQLADSLDPLTQLARDNGMAIILVGHFNKAGTTLETAIAGSRRLTGASRSTLIFGYEPGGGGDLVLAHHHSSFGEPSPSLLFKRETRPHPHSPNVSVPVMSLVGECDWTAEQVFSEHRKASTGGTPGSATKLAQAKAAILRFLLYAHAESGLSAAELQDAVTAIGLSVETFNAARSELAKEGLIEHFQTQVEGHGQHRWRLVKLDVPDSL